MKRPVAITVLCCAAAASLGLAGRLAPLPQASHGGAADLKSVFVTVETFARLEAQEQQQHVRYVYEYALPAFRSAARCSLVDPLFPPDRSQLSPTELADHILEKWGFCWLIEEGTTRCLEFLGNHHDLVATLVEEDLTLGNRDLAKRGLIRIGDLRLAEFYDSVVGILELDDGLSELAAYTLRDLGDPRAIAPLVYKHPSLKTFEILRSLQRGNAADPALVALLESDDSEVRWKAAYALAESGDPDLVPHIQRLALDEDERVRKSTASMAFRLKGESFKAVRPVLVSLLSDPSRKVRSFTAIVFAERKDIVCARTLLELLQDGSMKETEHSNIVQAVDRLTRSYFGYYHGSDAWEPTTPNNRKAIKAFAAWIEENESN